MAFLRIIANSRLLSVLREDKREIFRAAADAQRIGDHLLGFHPLYGEKLSAEQALDTAENISSAKAPTGPMPDHIRKRLKNGEQPTVPAMTITSADPPAPVHRPR